MFHFLNVLMKSHKASDDTMLWCEAVTTTWLITDGSGEKETVASHRSQSLKELWYFNYTHCQAQSLGRTTPCFGNTLLCLLHRQSQPTTDIMSIRFRPGYLKASRFHEYKITILSAQHLEMVRRPQRQVMCTNPGKALGQFPFSLLREEQTRL